MSDKQIDVNIVDDGSIVLFIPMTNDAKEWIEEFIPKDSPRMGKAVVVERRYSLAIAEGMIEHGLVLG